MDGPAVTDRGRPASRDTPDDERPPVPDNEEPPDDDPPTPMPDDDTPTPIPDDDPPTPDRTQPGFDSLFRSQFGALVALARLLGSDDPTDTAQEAFVRLYTRWPSLRDPQAALGYARSTVVNLTRNRKRHLAIAARHAARDLDSVVESAASAESESLAHAASETILRAVADLSPDRRAAVVLRYWLDLPFAQIAEILHCRPATARSHVRRALKKLHPILAQRGESP